MFKTHKTLLGIMISAFAVSTTQPIVWDRLTNSPFYKQGSKLCSRLRKTEAYKKCASYGSQLLEKACKHKYVLAGGSIAIGALALYKKYTDYTQRLREQEEEEQRQQQQEAQRPQEEQEEEERKQQQEAQRLPEEKKEKEKEEGQFDQALRLIKTLMNQKREAQLKEYICNALPKINDHIETMITLFGYEKVKNLLISISDEHELMSSNLMTTLKSYNDSTINLLKQLVTFKDHPDNNPEYPNKIIKTFRENTHDPEKVLIDVLFHFKILEYDSNGDGEVTFKLDYLEQKPSYWIYNEKLLHILGMMKLICSIMGNLETYVDKINELKKDLLLKPQEGSPNEERLRRSVKPLLNEILEKLTNRIAIKRA